MLAYVIRRILATIPVMAVVALFVFSLLYIAPGDPAAVIAGDQATPADVERIRQSLGLDRPFLIRFGEWVWQILHGDLGTSIFTNLPVTTMMVQRFEPTLSLMRSEEHTSELQSLAYLVCRLLLEKKKVDAHFLPRLAKGMKVLVEPDK